MTLISLFSPKLMLNAMKTMKNNVISEKNDSLKTRPNIAKIGRKLSDKRQKLPLNIIKSFNYRLGVSKYIRKDNYYVKTNTFSKMAKNGQCRPNWKLKLIFDARFGLSAPKNL